MSIAFDQARAWIARARGRLPALATLHATCVKDKEISNAFRMEVSELLGALRSALDYCANDLHARFGDGSSKVHFPICDHANAFLGALKAFPRLPQAATSIVRGAQPFADPDNAWLAELRMENNRAKHIALDAHSERMKREIHVTSKAGDSVMRITEDPGNRGGVILGNVYFADGAALTTGRAGVHIRPGGTVYGAVNIEGGPDGKTIAVGHSLPSVQDGSIEEVTIWKYIALRRSGAPVLGFVMRATDETEDLIERLSTI